MNLGQIACTGCVAGRFLNITGAQSASDCIQCPASTYSTTVAASSSSSCLLCPGGTFSDVVGASSSSTCRNCPAGFFGANWGVVNCTSCPTGKYSGTTAATSANTCLNCAAGRYSTAVAAAAASTCLQCPAGTFSTVVGASSLSTCLSCTAGRFSTVVGSNSVTDCQPCAPGTFSPTSGASNVSACIPCPAGSFTRTNGTSACSLCGPGRYSSTVGAASDSVCLPCPVGTYRSEPGGSSAASCRTCPSGRSTWNQGMESATACLVCPLVSARGEEHCLAVNDSLAGVLSAHVELDPTRLHNRGRGCLEHNGIHCTAPFSVVPASFPNAGDVRSVFGFSVGDLDFLAIAVVSKDGSPTTPSLLFRWDGRQGNWTLFQTLPTASATDVDAWTDPASNRTFLVFSNANFESTLPVPNPVMEWNTTTFRFEVARSFSGVRVVHTRFISLPSGTYILGSHGFANNTAVHFVAPEGLRPSYSFPVDQTADCMFVRWRGASWVACLALRAPGWGVVVFEADLPRFDERGFVLINASSVATAGEAFTAIGLAVIVQDNSTLRAVVSWVVNNNTRSGLGTLNLSVLWDSDALGIANTTAPFDATIAAAPCHYLESFYFAGSWYIALGRWFSTMTPAALPSALFEVRGAQLDQVVDLPGSLGLRGRFFTLRGVPFLSLGGAQSHSDPRVFLLGDVLLLNETGDGGSLFLGHRRDRECGWFNDDTTLEGEFLRVSNRSTLDGVSRALGPLALSDSTSLCVRRSAAGFTGRVQSSDPALSSCPSSFAIDFRVPPALRGAGWRPQLHSSQLPPLLSPAALPRPVVAFEEPSIQDDGVAPTTAPVLTSVLRVGEEEVFEGIPLPGSVIHALLHGAFLGSPTSASASTRNVLIGEASALWIDVLDESTWLVSLTTPCADVVDVRVVVDGIVSAPLSWAVATEPLVRDLLPGKVLPGEDDPVFQVRGGPFANVSIEARIAGVACHSTQWISSDRIECRMVRANYMWLESEPSVSLRFLLPSTRAVPRFEVQSADVLLGIAPPPSIASVHVVHGRFLATDNATLVRVVGAGLGLVADDIVAVTLGPSAIPCVVQPPSYALLTSFECETEWGAGADLFLRVLLSTNAEAVLPSAVDFFPPRITAVDPDTYEFGPEPRNLTIIGEHLASPGHFHPTIALDGQYDACAFIDVVSSTEVVCVNGRVRPLPPLLPFVTVEVTLEGQTSEPSTIFRRPEPVLASVTPRQDVPVQGPIAFSIAGDFGADDRVRRVRIGILECELVGTWANETACVLPAGMGFDLPLEITTTHGGVVVSEPGLRVSFGAPVVHDVAPRILYPGVFFYNVTIRGVHLSASPGFEPSVVEVGGVACADLVVFNDSLLECRNVGASQSPIGTWEAKDVRVVTPVGAEARWSVLAMDPPAIPHVEARWNDSSGLSVEVRIDHVLDMTLVTGVWVGPFPCRAQRVLAVGRLDCFVDGFGGPHAVTIATAFEVSATNVSLPVTFPAPEIRAVEPAIVGPHPVELRLTGHGFGLPHTANTTVTVGARRCTDATVLSSYEIRCQLDSPPDHLVGVNRTMEVIVHVGNQSSPARSVVLIGVPCPPPSLLNATEFGWNLPVPDGPINTRPSEATCRRWQCPQNWTLLGTDRLACEAVPGFDCWEGGAELLGGSALCVPREPPSAELRILSVERCGPVVQVKWTQPRSRPRWSWPSSVALSPSQRQLVDRLRDRAPWSAVVRLWVGGEVLANVTIDGSIESVALGAPDVVVESVLRATSRWTVLAWFVEVELTDRFGATETAVFNPATSALSSPSLSSPSSGALTSGTCTFVALTTVDSIVAVDPVAEGLTELLGAPVSETRKEFFDPSLRSPISSRVSPIPFSSLRPSLSFRVDLPERPSVDEEVTLACVVRPPGLALVTPARTVVTATSWLAAEGVGVEIRALAFDGDNASPPRETFEVSCTVTSSGSLAPTYGNATAASVFGMVVNEVWPYFEDVLVRSPQNDTIWTSVLGRWDVRRDRLVRAPQPVGSTTPFALTLSGTMDLLLVGDEQQFMRRGRPHFTAHTRVVVGSESAVVRAVSLDGRFLWVQTPNFSSICATPAACVGTRGYRALYIENPVTVPATLVNVSNADGASFDAELDSTSFEFLGVPWRALVVDDGDADPTVSDPHTTPPQQRRRRRLAGEPAFGLGSLNASDSIGMGVRCPPSCPGAAGQPMHSVSASEADRLRGDVVTSGVYYTDRCTGFETDPVVCLDAAAAQSCAWGAADDCARCPEGGFCPGGYRLWTQPGYWAVGETARSTVLCLEPRLERCVGWSEGATVCGLGFRQGSFACSACASGYYPSLGSCAPCPSDEEGGTATAWPSVRRLLIVVAVFAAFGAIVHRGTVLVLRRQRRPTSEAGRMVKHMVLWMAVAMQVVASVGRSASAGLPEYLKTMYSLLSVFLLDPSFAAHPDCLSSPPFLSDILLLSLVIVSGTVFLALAIAAPLPWPQDEEEEAKRTAIASLAASGPLVVNAAPMAADTATADRQEGAGASAGAGAGEVEVISREAALQRVARPSLAPRRMTFVPRRSSQTGGVGGGEGDAVLPLGVKLLAGVPASELESSSISSSTPSSAAISSNDEAAVAPAGGNAASFASLPSSSSLPTMTNPLLRAAGDAASALHASPASVSSPSSSSASSDAKKSREREALLKRGWKSVRIRHQLFAFLTLLYPITTSTVLNILFCRPDSVEEVDMGALERNPSSSVVPLHRVDRFVLATNPYVVCYEGTHLWATMLAVPVALFFVLGYPFGTWVWVHARIRASIVWVGAKMDEARRHRGMELREALRVVARAWAWRIRLAWFHGSVASAGVRSARKSLLPGSNSTNALWQANPAVAARRMSVARKSFMVVGGAALGGLASVGSALASTKKSVDWVASLEPREAYAWLQRQVDVSEEVLGDPNVRHFVFADFRPSYFFFRHLNFLALFGIAAANLVFRSVSVTFVTASAQLAVFVCILGSFLFVNLRLRPYTPSNLWKAAVKQYSLILSLLGALLNWVVLCRSELDMDVFGSSGTTGFIAVGSVVVFALSIGLLLTLFLAYWAVLLRGEVNLESQGPRAGTASASLGGRPRLSAGLRLGGTAGSSSSSSGPAATELGLLELLRFRIQPVEPTDEEREKAKEKAKEKEKATPAIQINRGRKSLALPGLLASANKGGGFAVLSPMQKDRFAAGKSTARKSILVTKQTVRREERSRTHSVISEGDEEV